MQGVLKTHQAETDRAMPQIGAARFGNGIEIDVDDVVEHPHRRGHGALEPRVIQPAVLDMKHPERVTKLFAYAANSDPSGVADISASDVFNTYIARAGEEYKRLSPSPTEYKSFVAEITRMWETQPNFTKAQLNAIKVPTWIVDADHDEAIQRDNTEFMAREIPNAGLLLQPEVSHFSMLQAPSQFTDDVRHFLERKWD